MNNLPSEIKLGCTRILGELVVLKDFRSVGGGCINHGGLLSTTAGNFFIKWNDAKKFPGMFEAEAKGLGILKCHTSLHIPQVIGWFEEGSYQGIVLEFVESKGRASSYWTELGTQLANLHNNSNIHFGLDHSNYIGSLRQFNNHSPAWTNFFIEHRLEVQLKLAINSGNLDASIVGQFQKLYNQLPAIFPDEKPALLHGDLWSGNVIVNSAGKPCLIDPAIYYGHREAELSFTHLFGGFGEQFL